ncbi:MAG: aminotransferase class I/II-fold pyridoxal phosphate-dependent enzyme, partial [Oryzihumus sp.]
MSELRPDTLAVRGGLARSGFEETAEALYLTSGFVYSSAEEAEAAFKEEVDRFVYSRYGNPTVAMFEERMRLLEGTEACFATGSGMAAVFVALAALLGQGDRVVAARGLFGSCFVILDEVLPRWGVETVFVDGPDLDQWREALSVPTTAVFFESPSNPMQELVDVRAVCDLAHAVGAQVVVDNVFGTPVFSRPLEQGADVIDYSATKHIDGQGRTLGGAVLGTAEFINGPVRNLMRHTGPSLSPFNAWVLLKGLETLRLRVERMAASALEIARALEAHSRVSRVVYPWLESHPQHELARAQMLG